MAAARLLIAACPIPLRTMLVVFGCAVAAIGCTELLAALGAAIDLEFLRDAGNNVPGGAGGVGAAGAGAGAAGAGAGRSGRNRLPRPDLPPNHPLNTRDGMQPYEDTGRAYAGDGRSPGPAPAPPSGRPDADWAGHEKTTREYRQDNPLPADGPPPTVLEQAGDTYEQGKKTLIKGILYGPRNAR